MALTATLHTFRIVLSDADRSVYETLDLRIARHPSESLPYLFARTLAYCLFWETDIEFSDGLSTADQPAVWVKGPDGRVSLWIDVGNPTAERLHKASKATDRVAVCTFQEPELFRRRLAGARIHRADAIELVCLPETLLAPLEAQLQRRMDWELTVSDGQLYLATGGQTLTGEVVRSPLLTHD